ncbi:MAG TPA: hypothetical protein VGG10_10220 [Rhizomicrobium sp.]|jgi:hypothetical protein
MALQVGLIAGLLFATGWTAAAETLNPQDGALLAPAAATALLHQCSRVSPKDFQGSWTPAAQQIRDLESALPAALQAELKNYPRIKLDSAMTVRQYAGLVLAGHKIIYVNALPRSHAINPNLPPMFLPDWRYKADMVCDGGPGFFGVEYDPATKRFAHFAFNGPFR